MNEIIISENHYKELNDLALSIKQRARKQNDAVLLMMAERLGAILTSGEVFVDFTEEPLIEVDGGLRGY